jgi:hypothetical protein
MDIFDFHAVASPIVKTLSKKQLATFSKGANAEIEASIRCYRQIVGEKKRLQRRTSALVNQTFTDFETQVNLSDPDTIVVADGAQCYAFTAEEIVDVMHGNLDSSTAEYEPGSGICTLTKTFSLPKNPWTQKLFCEAQIRDILGQIIVQRKTKHLLKYPEVAMFAMSYAAFDYKNNAFNMSGDIIDVFKRHGLQYQEKIWYDSVKKFCQNGSKWILSSPGKKKLLCETELEKNMLRG